MKKNIIRILIILPFIALSCNKSDNTDPVSGPGKWLSGSGIFIMNEGNFMAGNGSLSFYSFDSARVYNNLFRDINNRPLGDIPYSMTISGEKAFIVVNNSGKIEVVDLKTLKSLKTINGLDSPRNMLMVSSTKAYVSSLWSDRIAIIDLDSSAISGYINIRRSSEAMIMTNNKVYVSCWSSGSELMIIDPVTDKVTDSVTVGHEPESMALDKNNRLWVLCSGGYTGEYFPQLIRINTNTDEKEMQLQFSSKSLYPTSLCINKTGDTIYYIERGISRMSINDGTLPVANFVPASDRTYYKLMASRTGNGIFTTNVMDYQKNGYLLFIDSKGRVADSARTGIIPGNISYNKNLN